MVISSSGGQSTNSKITAWVKWVENGRNDTPANASARTSSSNCSSSSSSSNSSSDLYRLDASEVS